jgi:fructokinase
MPLWGGIEAGGTKFVCAVGAGPDDIRTQETFPTRKPDETLGACIEFFQRAAGETGKVDAIGVSCFGPVDPDPDSSTFGYITATPKEHWSYTDVAGPLREAFGVPVGFDTDVNGAALGEHRWGAAQGLDTFIYLTIGTGIGGGGLMNGELMHGLVHPEMGHMRLPHDLERDPFPGRCPFHGDCLEGLACGPAIEDRWGVSARELPADHEAWTLEAHYLALAVQNIICTLSPKRVIMGGGIMKQEQLLEKVRAEVSRLLNAYVKHPALLEHIDEYLVPPGLGDRAGVLGAIALAERAARP